MFSSRTAWDRRETPLALAAARARDSGAALVDMTESNPTRCAVPEIPAQIALLGDARGAEYQPEPLGLLATREAIARYHAGRGGEVRPERIALCASTSEAYGWLFKLLCERGESVLSPRPSYPLLPYLAGLEDVRVETYPLLREERFAIDLDALARAVDGTTRAIVLVHPNNPTGSLVRRDEAERVVELAAAHDLALVVDEVFADYRLHEGDGERVATFAGESRVLTFVLSGLSKVALLPQVKLGWIACSGPEGVAAEAVERLEILADAYLSVSTPVQLAAPEILARAGPVRARLRARLAANLHALDAALMSTGPGGPVRRLPVEAGWYAILEVPRVRTEEEWALLLLERDGLLVHPGYLYDLDREGYLVVSLLLAEEVFAPACAALLARLVDAAASPSPGPPRT